MFSCLATEFIPSGFGRFSHIRRELQRAAALRYHCTMSLANQTVSVKLPLPFFQQVERIASERHRTIEDVIQTTFAVALPTFSDLDPELQTDLMAMQMMSDDALQMTAGEVLSAEKQQRLTALTDTQDERDLSSMEQDELETLLAEWDAAALRRTQALAVLRQRGFDIHEFIRPAVGS